MNDILLSIHIFYISILLLSIYFLLLILQSSLRLKYPRLHTLHQGTKNPKSDWFTKQCIVWWKQDHLKFFLNQSFHFLCREKSETSLSSLNEIFIRSTFKTTSWPNLRESPCTSCSCKALISWRDSGFIILSSWNSAFFHLRLNLRRSLSQR